MTVDSPSPRAPRRVLLTGTSGQDGHYLAAQLMDEGADVYGLVRGGAVVGGGNPALAAGVRLLEGDMTDAKSLRAAIDAAQPDEVYNLAASTFVPGSWDDPALVADVNADGVERLVAAIRGCGAPIRLCHASSAEIFGPPSGRAQREDDPLAPHTPYGESKARAHRFLAVQREEHGLWACSAILFNHESPRRPPRFVTRKITMGAARIARGLEQELVLGSLDAARDWGYAPEYMTAMRMMVRSDAPRDYVVATGRAHTVRDFVRVAFERVGLDWQQYVKCDSEFARAGDNLARIGDPSRIAHDLGWRATTTFEQLVALMVDAEYP
ncbi:MAG: GDP-mannose 4,6-dehydratase [Candidatus Binatia bacterium]